MPLVPGLVALVVAGAGGYYLFVSSAAHKLGEVEDPPTNRRRVRLRRANGLILVLLALALIAIFAGAERRLPAVVLAGLVALAGLLPVSLALAIWDIRLTRRLRARLRAMGKDF